ncbi:RHS repeat domain-containing protein [Arcticibacter tournemirensis]
MNLPRTVANAANNQTITYLYDAAGRKLRKEGVSGNRDYVDGIEYGNDGQIEFIQTEEGRAVKSGGSYSYEYMLKDHLGNTRAVMKQDGSILQIPDYYAFGMQMNHNVMTPSPGNSYKYNGKELQTELGLNQYDYGARFYDPVVGRWNTIDPSVEKYISLSPYNYTVNNPIKYIDPDGRDFILTINRNKDGEIRGVTVSATVYITGTGASSERADELNTFAEGYFKKQNKTNVSINITYKYRKSVDKNKLGQGENILTFHSEPENGESHRSSVNGSRFGNRHFTGNSGNVYSSGMRSKTVLHETLHTMGLSDRYQDKYNPFTKEWYSEPHKGFENDIMGYSRGTGFDSSYGDYYLEAAKNYSNKYNKDRIPLRRMVDMRGNLLLSPYEDGGYHLNAPDEK